ncbi:hypothetical protein NQ315_009216 [Exocentrus adspersus]|uniref:receptor protein-tyrosine kinase n=1 Tax=Exocentrus adspersus TaxID=1586481 RepID=A0AAV8WH24_9CUCU|nr:hypothetical protein NQ315_009216 [Exocentrus adspersus]
MLNKKLIGNFSVLQPLAPYEFNFTDLYFGESYSIGIRAISDENYRYESTPVWLNITVPTCLQQFKKTNSNSIIAPETPENFQAEEVFRSANLLGNFPLYDIGMSWNKPNYTPDYYTVYLFDEGTNGVNNSSIILNVTGKQQLNTPMWLYAGYINATAILLANESWISTEVVLLIVCPVIIIISVLLYAFIRLMAKKTQLDYFEEIDKTLPSIDYTITPVKESESLDAWELLEEKLLIKDVLGEGAFGVVRKGEYDLGEGKRTEVAIKMLKGNPDTEEKRQILQEINIMKSVPAHPHLVSLIGCITQGSLFGPLLVVEYCSKGDLHSYLRNILDKLHNPFYANQLDSIIIGEDIKCASNRLYDLAVLENNDIPQPKDLISYARQIAIGMEYLTSLKLIHRDLAARNVLISSDNTVKISDFGLSRDVYYDKVYCKTTRGKLPIRWMALESLTHQVYTSQSDVWSFGILLWEIVTLGSTPYPGLSTGELLVLLKDGYRMKKPSNCSDELYLIMSKCWKATPKERPTFTELRKALDDTLETISHYLDLNTSEASDISTCQNNKPRNTGSLERYVIQMKEV